MLTRLAIIAAALALGGCATSYHLTLMPRDSGKLYYGVADDTSGGEGPIAITIEGKAYSGTWIQAVPDRGTGYVSGAYYGGWGHRGGWGWGMGSTVTFDNPAGGQATALLQAADGSGMRCEFFGSWGRGAGSCRDDKGLAYDVQLRPQSPKSKP